MESVLEENARFLQMQRSIIQMLIYWKDLQGRYKLMIKKFKAKADMQLIF